MKVAFLDRDGVINQEVNYLHEINKFEYTYKCIDGLKMLIKLGFRLIIITNQAGIAKGLFTERDYYSLTDWYLNDLKNNDIDILDVYHCPHHNEGIVKSLSIDCECRKPKPGMINSAIKKYDIDLSSSILIGDKISDIMAGINAGIKKQYLVKSGHIFDYDDIPSDVCVEEDLYHVAKRLSV